MNIAELANSIESESSEASSSASEIFEEENCSASSSEQLGGVQEVQNEENNEENKVSKQNHSLKVGNVLQQEVEKDKNQIKFAQFKKTRSINQSQSQLRQGIRQGIRQKHEKDIPNQFKKQSLQKSIKPSEINERNKSEITQRFKKHLQINTNIRQKLGVIQETDSEDSAVPKGFKNNQKISLIELTHITIKEKIRILKEMGNSREFQYLYLIAFVVLLFITQIVLYFCIEM